MESCDEGSIKNSNNFNINIQFFSMFLFVPKVQLLYENILFYSLLTFLFDKSYFAASNDANITLSSTYGSARKVAT